MEQIKQETRLKNTRNILLALAAIMGLQMSSFGIIMPIFARRLGDFGDGVEALGLMAMAYSITSMTAAPIMGSLADRVGRRPLVLISLAAYAAAFTGYLLAPSTQVFVIIRALAGALTAGLGPAVMGIVGDIAPDDKRAQWLGVIGGGTSIGWVVGPTLGGLLYDRWGYVAPFAVSVALAVLALIAAVVVVPETVTQRRREFRGMTKNLGVGGIRPFFNTLPKPLSTFSLLLLVSFTTIFAYAFIEPQLMFYVYDDLGWSSARFGLAVSGFGLTLVWGQTILGKLSDRFGRKPILIIGILLSGAMYATVSSTTSFQLIFLAYIIAGLGEALMGPALRAFYLDIANTEHKSRVMGIAGTAGALGGVAGPALVVMITRIVPPQSVFAIAVGLLVGAALLALVILKEPRKVEKQSHKPLTNQTKNQILASEHA